MPRVHVDSLRWSPVFSNKEDFPGGTTVNIPNEYNDHLFVLRNRLADLRHYSEEVLVEATQAAVWFSIDCRRFCHAIVYSWRFMTKRQIAAAFKALPLPVQSEMRRYYPKQIPQGTPASILDAIKSGNMWHIVTRVAAKINSWSDGWPLNIVERITDFDTAVILNGYFDMPLVWQMAAAAAASGDLDKLEWYDIKGFSEYPQIATAAVQAGHLHVLTWIHEHEYAVSSATIRAALYAPSTEIVEYLLDRYPKPARLPQEVNMAHLDALFRRDVCVDQLAQVAIRAHRTDLLQQILARYPEPEPSVLDEIAVVYNNLDALRIVRTCEWTLTRAVVEGRTLLAKYLVDQGYDMRAALIYVRPALSSDILEWALCFGHINRDDIRPFAHEEGWQQFLESLEPLPNLEV